MIVKDNFYITKDFNPKTTFVPAASTISYISHKEEIMAYYEMHNYIIRCMLNEEEKITLRVKKNTGSKNYQLMNCDWVENNERRINGGYLHWEDAFIEEFSDFIGSEKQ